MCEPMPGVLICEPMPGVLICEPMPGMHVLIYELMTGVLIVLTLAMLFHRHVVLSDW